MQWSVKSRGTSRGLSLGQDDALPKSWLTFAGLREIMRMIPPARSSSHRKHLPCRWTKCQG